MPAYWAPWPVNRNPTDGDLPAAGTRPRRTSPDASRAASSPRRVRRHTAGVRSDCGPCSPWSTRPLPCGPRLEHRLVAARQLVERGRAASGQRQARVRGARRRCRRWPVALAAPTPARRGRWSRSSRTSSRRQSARRRSPATGSAASGRRNGRSSHAIRGLGSWKWRLGGTVPCCSASTALITPATPAAPSVCPRFVLIEPSSTSSGLSPKTSPQAARLDRVAEAGPRAVRLDVSHVRDCTPGTASASRMTSTCARSLETVKPLAGPSWLMADHG